MEEKLYLDNEKKSWIITSTLPNELKKYATDNFDALFNLHPINKGSVIVHNTMVDVNRWYTSYMNTPKWDLKSGYSYMFSDIYGNFKEKYLPEQFMPFLEYVNKDKNVYNQVVVNWYETSDNYIAQHSDCEIGLNTDVPIIILTLNKNDIDFRTLKITSKKNITKDPVLVPLKHGSIIKLGGDIQKKYRHGVPKVPSNIKTVPRISMSFRSFV